MSRMRSPGVIGHVRTRFGVGTLSGIFILVCLPSPLWNRVPSCPNGASRYQSRVEARKRPVFGVW